MYPMEKTKTNRIACTKTLKDGELANIPSYPYLCRLFNLKCLQLDSKMRNTRKNIQLLECEDLEY